MAKLLTSQPLATNKFMWLKIEACKQVSNFGVSQVGNTTFYSSSDCENCQALWYLSVSMDTTLEPTIHVGLHQCGESYLSKCLKSSLMVSLWALGRTLTVSLKTFSRDALSGNPGNTRGYILTEAQRSTILIPLPIRKTPYPHYKVITFQRNLEQVLMRPWGPFKIYFIHLKSR